MLNNSWLKAEFNRLVKATRPSRKQRKLVREGRSLRVETLEERRLLAFTPVNLTNGDIFVGDFEHPDGFQLESRTFGNTSGNPDSPYITANNGLFDAEITSAPLVDGIPVRNGQHVFVSHLERQLNPNAPANQFSYRAEILPRLTATSISQNQDLWYGFSIYIPLDYEQEKLFEILSQWRLEPANPQDIIPVPLKLVSRRSTKGPHDIIINTAGPGGGGDIVTLPVSEFRGKWTDFVFHVRWSNQSDGILEVWRNEEADPLVRRVGANFGNSANTPQHRLGLYKGWRQSNAQSNIGNPVTERTVYYDEYRVARGANRRSDVTPQGVRPGSGGPTNGDFDLDGDTDGADFLAWQRGFFGGTYDADDLTDWEDHYGDGPVAPTGTLLHYDFSSGSGNVVDQSGNGNGGTLVGFDSTAAGAGQFNTSEGWVSSGGLSFLDDSVRSYVDTGLPLSALAGKNATIEFTGTFTGASGLAPAIGSDGASFNRPDAFFFGIKDASTSVHLRNPNAGGADLADSPWSAPDNTEHHVVMTFDASTDRVEIFVDGDLVRTTTRAGSNFLDNPDNFRIGNVGWSDDQQWGGVLTGVAISDEILIPENFVLSVSSPPLLAAGIASAASAAPGDSLSLTADMFSPVASRVMDDSVLDEAFAGSGGLVSATQSAPLFEHESDASTSLTLEQAEEEEASEAFAESLDFAFQLL